MSTEVHECANGNLKQTEVEPLGEIKEELQKPVDLYNTGDAIGNKVKGGCESLGAEKVEPLTKHGASKQKHVVNSGEEEDANEPQDGNNYSSEEEEDVDEGDEEAREGEEAYEEDDDDYANDGEEDEGEEDESEPPSKRRK